MVAAVDTRATQGTVISLATGKADLRLTQASLLAVYQHPTPTLRTTQGEIAALIGSKPAIRTTQATVLVLYTVGAENRKMRAWGFSQDGHDFYVLRGGTSWSLVYDITTGQWSRWTTPTKNYLRAHLGLNWDGQAKTTLDRGFAWNVVGADDTTGDLWILDPTQNLDEDVGGGTYSAFTREVVGGIPQRLRKGTQCGAVYLTANLGSPELTAPTVTLTTSDDSGVNWVNQGSITVTSDPTQELSWLGLGLITAPGRLFKITDSGALNRISSLDMRGLEE